MTRRAPIALIAAAALAACAEPRPAGPAPDTIVRGKASRATLRGSAGFRGQPPRAQDAKLEPAVAKLAGAEALPDETWRVDRLARLADVVILALPRDARFTSAKAELLDLAITGPRFERRVLVAAPGSTLRVTRRSGPTMSLRLIALSGPASSSQPLDLALPEKAPVEAPLEAPGVYRLADPDRPYLRAFIVVAATPYTAITGPGGDFRIIVPPGAYTLRAWHEAAGWAKDSLRQLDVEQDNAIEVEYAVVDSLVQGRIFDPETEQEKPAPPEDKPPEDKPPEIKPGEDKPGAKKAEAPEKG